MVGLAGIPTTVTVKNTNMYDGNQSVTIDCRRAGAVTGCYTYDIYGNPVTYKTLTIAPGKTASATFYYNVASTPGTGSLTFDGGDGMVKTVTVNVVPRPTSPPLHTIAVAPSFATVESDSSTSPSIVSFQLTEQGNDSATYSYSVSCSGAAFSSACTPATGNVLLYPYQSQALSVSFATASPIGSVGTLKLLVTRVGDAAVRDSAIVSLTTVRGSPGVSVASVNPGTSLERSQCLNASVAPGAAYECGGLRLAIGLPEVRSRNKARAPVLLYQSQDAHPRPVVLAEVTLPPDGQVPQQVTATLRDSAGATLETGTWAGADWPANGTRRIGLSFDALAWPTGVHRYTLEVTRVYGSSSSTDLASGELVVVNRSASPFGPGWWMAGLEQLVPLAGGSGWLWVAGDGSARRYNATGIPNRWAAAPLDRPDTLTFDGTFYRRRLRGGVSILFDALGRHVMTLTRLDDTTRFTYDGASRLDGVVVPRAGFGLTYAFGYGPTPHGERLTSVTAPPLGQTPRVTTLNYDGTGLALSVQNPGEPTTTFQYDPATAYRVTSRSEATQTTTFAFGPAGLLAGASMPLNDTLTATVAIASREELGLPGSGAVSRDRDYTRIDGPRAAGVGDTSLFWLDGRGMPRRTRDALGNETLITRGDARWPGLVTRVRTPDGRVLFATYDHRGRLATTTDSSRYDPARSLYATSSYEWDPTWDFVTATRAPEGDSTRTAYDPATGNRLWQQDGRGAMSRVHFYYYPTGAAAGLLSSVVHAGTGARDSVEYDPVRANLSRTISPVGNWTETFADAVGRDTLVRYPIDAAGTMYSVVSRKDIAGRDTLIVTGAGGDTTRVRSHYDAAGNLDTLARWGSPMPSGVVTQAFEYDRANRKTAERLVGYNVVRSVYDEAGNLLSGGRRPSVNGYDALNRIAASIVTSSSGQTPDTSRFTYDAAGRLRSAMNSVARINRSYSPSGDLVADTSRVASASLADRNFESHVYGVRSGYDLNGRRTWIKYPGALAPAGQDSVAYQFDPAAGFLTAVRDPFGNRYTFGYNPEGQLDALVRWPDSATPVTESRTYYADGTLRTRRQQVGADVLHADTLTYDRRGKPLANAGIVRDTYEYTPLGALKLSKGEEYYPDAFGTNMSSYTHVGDNWTRTSYLLWPNSDRLQLAARPAQGSGTSLRTDTTKYVYNGANGNLIRQTRDNFYVVVHRDYPFERIERSVTSNSYRSDHLMESSRFQLDTVGPIWPEDTYQSYSRQERYRYDALGRRVWRQVYRATNCPTHDKSSGCRNETTRVVWDGDQILYEVRQIADSTTMAEESDVKASSTLGNFTGRVGYVHGGGIDEPLMLFKDNATGVILPFTNWQGQFDLGLCPLVRCAETAVGFPAAEASAYWDMPLYPDGPPSWRGDIILGQIDASGYMYRRNRYYDPGSGRFTQEDPIGIAGGLNLYGYANGDPVNYSDPFGLCDDSKPCPRDQMLTDLANAANAAVAQAARIGAEFVDALTGLFSGAEAVAGRDMDGNQLSGTERVGKGMVAAASMFPGGSGDRAAARLTTGQARDLAGWLGFTKTVKDAPMNSMGQAVFSDGRRFITQDITMHQGAEATWKLFDRSGTRIGTYNYDLTKLLGK